MFASIVATALLLDGAFALVGWTPQGAREIAALTQFKIDYTFWMNVVSVAVVGGKIYPRRQHRRMHEDGRTHGHDHDADGLSQASRRLFLHRRAHRGTHCLCRHWRRRVS